MSSNKPQKESEDMNTSPMEDTSHPKQTLSHNLVETIHDASTQMHEALSHFQWFEGISGQDNDDEYMDDFVNLVPE
ncbi:uncharacterized protein J8A68_003076 [[Candida] subhashii]|uniref:Uncharacterized protein n=1 Tax=[Candida] subhashii TaxID=561895 RepID=A0A8J5UZ48_9ASCO|nr:uncharacterized protein J8A68_003076 [[Candida] subhashii]KAG7663424.1 hypothetical protein J8A68_003076 [[Candida] subhashii]